MSKYRYILFGALVALINTSAKADCSKEYWTMSARSHKAANTPFSNEEAGALSDCIHSVAYTNQNAFTNELLTKILDKFSPSKPGNPPQNLVGDRMNSGSATDPNTLLRPPSIAGKTGY